ncbi:hypothetical protein ACIRRH_26135 [Kitasatospora sp. NPDC101235]|uniref:hypothetical protein n=1 Tax=Kitasatospora sp. NPDC101235 TaxID=3364101 RepID=UPI0037F9D34E
MKDLRIVLWSTAARLVVTGGLGWAGWAAWQKLQPSWPEVPDPVGRWSGGTAVVEFMPEGRVGSAQVPAYVCSSSAADKARPTEIEGRWQKSFFDDVGPAVHVEAKRKDDGGTCMFWLTAEENGKDLWLLKSPGFLMTKS